MKNFILFTGLLFIILSCEKTIEEPVIKGKLVFRSCASVVVQVLESQHYNLTQEKWQRSANEAVYEHVFTVSNYCSFPTNVAVGKEFTFKVIAPNNANNCAVCAVFDNPPQKQQHIEVVSANPN